MNQTPTGKPSAKRAPGQTWRRFMRMQAIARLDLLGRYSNSEIAISQGISVVRVGQIKNSPEYHAILMQVKTGILSEYDKNMFADIDEMREALTDMVPEALTAIKDALLDKSNPKLRFQAAEALLDREGTLAKVSKSEIKSVVKHDWQEQEAIESSLFDALQQAANNELPTIEELGVSEFSQSAQNEDSHKKLEHAMEIIHAAGGSTTIQ